MANPLKETTDDELPPQQQQTKIVMGKFGLGYIDYEGICFLPLAHTPEELRRNFIPFKEDIIVASYPQCGTGWVQQIVGLLLCNGETEDISKLVSNDYFLEFMAGRGKLNSQILSKETPDHRRVMKTHTPWQLLPCKELRPQTKIIYITRNPKDVAVSYFHHALRMEQFKFTGNFSNFLHLFREGKIFYGSWFDHTIGWWKASKDLPNQILFMTYEDVKLKPKEMITKIANFIEVEASEELIDKVVHMTNFDTMKKQHISNPKFRKGQIGDWKHHFTVYQNELFDQLYDEKMAAYAKDIHFCFT